MMQKKMPNTTTPTAIPSLLLDHAHIDIGGNFCNIAVCNNTDYKIAASNHTIPPRIYRTSSDMRFLTMGKGDKKTLCEHMHHSLASADLCAINRYSARTDNYIAVSFYNGNVWSEECVFADLTKPI